jgi:hypothetical protein
VAQFLHQQVGIARAFSKAADRAARRPASSNQVLKAHLERQVRSCSTRILDWARPPRLDAESLSCPGCHARDGAFGRGRRRRLPPYVFASHLLRVSSAPFHFDLRKPRFQNAAFRNDAAPYTRRPQGPGTTDFGRQRSPARGPGVLSELAPRHVCAAPSPAVPHTRTPVSPSGDPFPWIFVCELTFLGAASMALTRIGRSRFEAADRVRVRVRPRCVLCHVGTFQGLSGVRSDRWNSNKGRVESARDKHRRAKGGGLPGVIVVPFEALLATRTLRHWQT